MTLQPCIHQHAYIANKDIFLFNHIIITHNKISNDSLLLLFRHPVIYNSLQLMDCSMPGLPVPHHLPEFAQVHVHCISDAIQPSHPLTHPSPSALNLFQHQRRLMSHLFASDDQNTGSSPSASVLPVNIQDWSPLRLTGLISLLSKWLSGVFSSTTVQRHQFFGVLPSLQSSSHNHTWSLYGPLSAEWCLYFSKHCLGLSSFSCQEAIVFWFYGCSHCPQWFSVQLSSVAQSCPTLWDPMGCSTPGPHCPSPAPIVYSNSRPLSRWCHPTISSSIIPSPPAFNLSQHQGLSNESVLHISWPKYWSFSFSISPSNEYSGLISFRMDWLDLLAIQETLKSLLQHHSSKPSILRCSAFFIVQISHPYMTYGKTIALTRHTFCWQSNFSAF